MSGSSVILKRRQFVTRAAMLLVSTAVLASCDDELGLDDCAVEPDLDEPECPEPAEPEPEEPVRAPETFPGAELDDEFRFLRSFE